MKSEVWKVFLVFRGRLCGPSDRSILGGSRVGVLVHISNASEMDWTLVEEEEEVDGK